MARPTGAGALGACGDIGAFSLQLEKNITSGEGGLVVTDDDALYLRAARYQDQGGQFVTSHGGGRGDELAEPFVGENLRMTEIAGAIAGVQLAKLDGAAGGDARQQGAAHPRGRRRRRRPRPAAPCPIPTATAARASRGSLPTADQRRALRQGAAARGHPVPRRCTAACPCTRRRRSSQKRTASGKGGPWNCAEHPTRRRLRAGHVPAHRGPGRPRRSSSPSAPLTPRPTARTSPRRSQRSRPTSFVSAQSVPQGVGLIECARSGASCVAR